LTLARDIDALMTSLPFDQIKGEKLTREQQSYLEGLFAGLKNRGFSFADVLPNPATITEAKPASTPDMIFEERVKHELHPLDAFPLLLEHAASNKPPERENIFRFKWNGLFISRPPKKHSCAGCGFRPDKSNPFSFVSWPISRTHGPQATCRSPHGPTSSCGR